MKNIRKHLPSYKILNKKTWLYFFLYYYFKGTLIEIVRVLEEFSVWCRTNVPLKVDTKNYKDLPSLS